MTSKNYRIPYAYDRRVSLSVPQLSAPLYSEPSNTLVPLAAEDIGDDVIIGDAGGGRLGLLAARPG